MSSPGESAGNPAELAAAGNSFRDFANIVANLIKTELLQAGGDYEYWATEIAPPDQSATGVTDFTQNLTEYAQLLTTKLIGLEPLLQDAALDLWSCGHAFKAADVLPVPFSLERSPKPHRWGMPYPAPFGFDPPPVTMTDGTKYYVSDHPDGTATYTPVEKTGSTFTVRKDGSYSYTTPGAHGAMTRTIVDRDGNAVTQTFTPSPDRADGVPGQWSDPKPASTVDVVPNPHPDPSLPPWST